MIISTRLPAWLIIGLLVIIFIGIVIQGIESSKKYGNKTKTPPPPPAWAQSPVMQHAHSHNDYKRKRPLLDALDHDFWSVEADIFLQNGTCVVAHDRKDIQPGNTLVSMYLEPLWEQFNLNAEIEGRIHPECDEFLLLVDMKEDGDEIYNALEKELEPYSAMLTRIDNRQFVQGRVLICLSGERPIKRIKREKSRLFFLDGRPFEPGNQTSFIMNRMTPLVSNSIKHYLKPGSRKKKAITAEDLDADKIRFIVESCHKNHQKFRLWGYPDDPTLWQCLLELGVDLINTDDPKELSEFLQGHTTSL